MLFLRGMLLLESSSVLCAPNLPCASSCSSPAPPPLGQQVCELFSKASKEGEGNARWQQEVRILQNHARSADIYKTRLAMHSALRGIRGISGMRSMLFFQLLLVSSSVLPHSAHPLSPASRPAFARTVRAAAGAVA